MSINKNELTKEQIAKAMSCETAEERTWWRWKMWNLTVMR